MKEDYIPLVFLLLGICKSDVASAPSVTYRDPAEAVANCLVEKQVKMYGSWWCSDCVKQKKEFGQAWSIMEKNYIECSPPESRRKLPVCADIKFVPTWVFPNERYEDFLTLEQLAEKAGCYK